MAPPDGATELALLLRTVHDWQMRQMTIQLSDEVAEELQPYQDRLREVLLLGLLQLKIQESLLLYSRGLVSIGRAAELAGLPLEEMIRNARVAGIQPRTFEEMVQEELA